MNQQKPSTTGLGRTSHVQRMARLIEHRKDLQRRLMNLNESGLYQRYCARCEKNFLGHKRRLICKCCNSAIPNALADAMLGRIRVSPTVP